MLLAPRVLDSNVMVLGAWRALGILSYMYRDCGNSPKRSEYRKFQRSSFAFALGK